LLGESGGTIAAQRVAMTNTLKTLDLSTLHTVSGGIVQPRPLQPSGPFAPRRLPPSTGPFNPTPRGRTVAF
jgi:hypothetical protein